MAHKNRWFLQSQSLLAGYFYTEGSMSQRVVSAKMEVPESTMGNWVAGINAIPTEMFVLFYEVTKHHPALELLVPDGMTFGVQGAVSDRGTMCGEGLDLTIAVGRLVERYQEINSRKNVPAGEKFSKKDCLDMKAMLALVKQETAEFEDAIDHGKEVV